MKMRFGVLIMSVILVSTILVAGGSKKEELYGTWVNYEYKGSTPFFMNIYNPDGTYQDYRLEASAWEVDVEKTDEGWIKAGFGPYEIIEKWTDEDGSIWYKTESLFGNEKFFSLMKLSDSGNTLEYMLGRIGYPEEIEPNDVKYRIYYCQ